MVNSWSFLHPPCAINDSKRWSVSGFMAGPPNVNTSKLSKSIDSRISSIRLQHVSFIAVALNEIEKIMLYLRSGSSLRKIYSPSPA